MRDSKDNLKRLLDCPPLFTGEHTLNSIARFLAGYRFALDEHEIETADDFMVLPQDFHDWVAYRLRYGKGSWGYVQMIESRTQGDAAAVSMFTRLLNEHRIRQTKVVARLQNY